MKKFLLSIFALMLAVFSVQAEEVKYQISSATSVTTDGTAPSGSTATFKNTYTSNKEQLTKNNSMTLTLKGYTGCKITGITLYMKSNKSAGAGSFTMKAGATELSAITASAFNNKNWNGAYTTTYTDVVPVMKNTDYIIGDGEDVIITIAATVNSLYCQSFTITYENVGGGETPDVPEVKTVTTPVISAESTTFNEGESLIVTIETETEGAEIYYTLDGSAPVENGVIYKGEIKLTETTTVKAVAKLDGWNNSAVAEATFTAIDPNAASFKIVASELEITNGGAVESLTFGDVTATFGKGTNSNNAPKYYTTGTAIRCYGGNTITFTGAKGVTITGIELTFANGEDTNDINADCGTYSNNAWTGESNKVVLTIGGTSGHRRIAAIKVSYSVGENVVVIATPSITASTSFVGSTTVEITNNEEGTTLYYSTNGVDYDAYTEALNITETTTVYAKAVNGENESDVVSKTYTRVAATPEIGFDGDASAFENEIDVLVSTENNTPVYYTLDGSTPDAESTLYKAPLTIKANATLKVIAIEDGGYKSGVVSQAFKKAASGSSDTATGMATLVEDAEDLVVGDKVVIVATKYDYALSTTQNTNNRGSVGVTKDGDNVSVGAEVQVITLEDGTVDGTFAFYTGSGYLYAASSSSNYLKTQTTNNDNGSWKIEIASGIATIKAQGTNTKNWLRFNNTNNPKIFSCYDSNQTDVSIYKVDIATVEDYVLNVSAAGWATLYLGYNVVIPGDVTCYVISEVGAESVQLKEVAGVLPANTAVIVKAAKGEHTFAVTEETATVENVMEGTLNNEYITKDAYVLGIVDGVVGLYKAEKAGGVWLNNANKAYLPASEVPASAALSAGFRFDFDGTTAIEEVETETAETVIYDLTGRRVNEITKAGVYIINGKKTLVK